MSVFVLDKTKKPLMPCSEKRARLLLERGRAVVARRHPFTIRLKDRSGGVTQPVRVKLDPGSKTSGVAVVREAPDGQHVVWLAEIQHRGHAIREAMDRRRAFRKRRRGNLRHRPPRFDNRTRSEGWLPPSLQHRVDTTTSWVNRLQRLAPIEAISMELVRFDTQKLVTPEIRGTEYQQGTLAGYEVREYLLEKWGRTCAYCDARDVPLEVEHIHPRSKGGSDRVSNLTLACHACNQAKGSLDVRAFVENEARLARILKHAKAPLRDAAAVNATRWALCRRLEATGLPVEVASGGRTKFNRSRHEIPKTHALDAANVGEVSTLHAWRVPTLVIRATGRGSYQRTRLTKHGFPRGYLMRSKRIHGFQTGDHVRATVPTGKKAGVHEGRVAVRATGSFNIQAPAGTVQGIHHRHCRLLQRARRIVGWRMSATLHTNVVLDALKQALHASDREPVVKTPVFIVSSCSSVLRLASSSWLNRCRFYLCRFMQRNSALPPSGPPHTASKAHAPPPACASTAFSAARVNAWFETWCAYYAASCSLELRSVSRSRGGDWRTSRR